MAAKARLKALEARLQELYQRGGETNEYVGGYGGGHLHAVSFEAVQQHEEERRLLALEVKAAREEVHQESDQLRQHCSGVNDASTWTSKLLSGDGERFEVADNGVERQLAEATHGLVTAAAFKQKREELEAANLTREEDIIAEAERKRRLAEVERKAKKKKQRQAQASKLSFDDEDKSGEEDILPT